MGRIIRLHLTVAQAKALGAYCLDNQEIPWVETMQILRSLENLGVDRICGVCEQDVTAGGLCRCSFEEVS